ncbi:hypothetical protein BKA65DRAFT_567569 [Rhexocercosporidium sp. MPI-PUGE-AT-0058]|nr:hypothetical protein BKA65DRAFT_567569 [Rhexocercosporidium sp. MPI-PUGE-AT-0058]
MGYIYKRTKLSPAETRELERQQFNELDSEDKIKLEAMNERVGGDRWLADNSEFSREGVGSTVVDTDHVKLSMTNMRSLIGRTKSPETGDEVIRGALEDAVIDQYIAMICRYINEIRRKKSDHLVSAHEQSSRPEYDYRSHSPEPPLTETPEPYYPSCRYISTSVLRDLAEKEDEDNAMDTAPAPTLIRQATKILKDMDCTGEKFFKLDYLFIVYTDGGHYRVLGLAPKQKYAFSIDSVQDYWDEGRTIDKRFIMAVLLSQMPGPDTWPIYGQWAYRGDDKYDGSPNCCRQGDDYNCGTMTVTNAFCLAFGFDLLCYRQRDIDTLKRPRMFAEMSNGGFSGKYAYDMLDIPNQPEFTESRERYPRTDLPDTIITPDTNSTADHGNEERLADDSKELIEAANTSREEDADEEDIEDPLHEARGVLSKRTSKGRILPDFLFANREGNPASRLSIAAQIGEKLGKRPVRLRRESEMERRVFPPQFDPKYFRKEGFLYGSTLGHPILQGRTKNELAAVLIDSLIAKNEEIAEWSMESNEIFGKWAENKILGFLARLLDESVRPFGGLVEGFGEWLEKYRN